MITARDGEQGIQQFLTHNPDLVLLDVNMPNMDGYQCAQRIRENGQQGNLWIPIIFLRAKITEDAIVKGINSGGDDYLPKPVTPRVLSAKLRGMSRIANMRKELEAASARLKLLSSIDGLTQLCNRRHFNEVLELEWSSAERTQEPLSLILCDIDHFKAFNDNYAHVAGDDALAIPHDYSNASNIVSMSIGVSSYYPAQANSSFVALLDAADRGLYRSKKNSHNRITMQPL